MDVALSCMAQNMTLARLPRLPGLTSSPVLNPRGVFEDGSGFSSSGSGFSIDTAAKVVVATTGTLPQLLDMVSGASDGRGGVD